MINAAQCSDLKAWETINFTHKARTCDLMSKLKKQ